MSFQKALCLICTLPTADGALLAVQVDKDKLQTWFLNVCGYELPHEIADEDKICYFCLWQAEFMRTHNDVMADDALVWWPENVDFDNAARELRKNFLEGNANQCWVQLENVKLPESEDEENATPNHQRECIYCGNRFEYPDKLSIHVQKTHKDEAIRCDNQKCPTDFHPLEEKEEHIKNVHKKSKEQENFKCSFCGKEFEGQKSYREHVRKVHKDFPVKCSQVGCLSFFKNQNEMKSHFDSAHEKDEKAKKFQCNDCDYKAMQKSSLERHVALKHLPKFIKCEKCVKLFSIKSVLRQHVRGFHRFMVCKFCKLGVTVFAMEYDHLNMRKCTRCKDKFQCSGLYQLHLKSCKSTLHKCVKCQETFDKRWKLNKHIKSRHENDK